MGLQVVCLTVRDALLAACALAAVLQCNSQECKPEKSQEKVCAGRGPT